MDPLLFVISLTERILLIDEKGSQAKCMMMETDPLAHSDHSRMASLIAVAYRGCSGGIMQIPLKFVIFSRYLECNSSSIDDLWPQVCRDTQNSIGFVAISKVRLFGKSCSIYCMLTRVVCSLTKLFTRRSRGSCRKLKLAVQSISSETNQASRWQIVWIIHK